MPSKKQLFKRWESEHEFPSTRNPDDPNYQSQEDYIRVNAMIPQTPEQKAEQAWLSKSIESCEEYPQVYHAGHIDTLSALIRETEKRIEELEEEYRKANYSDAMNISCLIEENKRFLKLIGEVKP